MEKEVDDLTLTILYIIFYDSHYIRGETGKEHHKMMIWDRSFLDEASENYLASYCWINKMI